jgi:hypothetical protein
MPFRWIDPKTAPAKLCPTELAEEKESKVNDLILRDEKGKRQGKVWIYLIIDFTIFQFSADHIIWRLRSLSCFSPSNPIQHDN